MIYYQSKYLSQKLQINLAKWKRWSRDFLPPDALGGLQSGIARQFNLKEAFKVYLGGYLVGELKFTIPDAVTIMTDLSPWLNAHGFFDLQPRLRRHGDKASARHHIYIHCLPPRRFAYSIRTILESAAEGEKDHVRETFLQTLIHTPSDPIRSGHALSAHMVAITPLYLGFLERIG
jgi:hypothetical protein